MTNNPIPSLPEGPADGVTQRFGHTSGPWYPGHLGDDSLACECKSICDEGFAGGIATVHVWNGIESISEGGNDCPPYEQAVANMHLISAAPDLLDACQVAIGHMTGGMDGDWRDCDPVAVLRAAIAKALPPPPQDKTHG